MTPIQAATKAAKPFPKMLIIVVVIVVAAAAALGGLFAAGVFNTSSSSSSGGGGGGGSGETFKAAVTTATPSANGVAGGPWTVIGGSGVSLSSSITVNETLLNESFDFGCQTKALPGVSSITSLPGTTAASSSGQSNLWVVIFSNASGDALEVAVLNGVATPVLTLESFHTCEESTPLLSLPSTIEDSPSPAAAAWTDGGSGYAANHSAYDVELIVLNVSLWGPTWVITYTNCDPTDSGATLDGNSPAQFTSAFYAVNGTLIFKENGNSACPKPTGSGGGGGGGGKPNLDTCLVAGYEENDTTIFYNNESLGCYTITGLTSGDITVSIENNTTLTKVSTTGFTLQIVNTSSSGSLASYDFGTNTWSSTTVPLTGSHSYFNWFVLTSSKSLAGDRIVFTATASAPATGSVYHALGNEI